MPEPWTFKLEGLVEGSIPSAPGLRERVEEFVRAADSADYLFSLDIDGGTFSLLADETPSRVDRNVDRDRPSTLTDLLNQLMQVLPDGHRTSVFSTLRSVEYRDDVKVETVYAAAEGRFEHRSREIPWQPPTRPSKAPPRRVVLVGAILLAALIVLWITGALDDMIERFKNPDTVGADAADIAVDAEAFQGFLAVRVKDVFRDRIILEITRAPSCPRDIKAFQTRLAELVEANDSSGWAACDAAFRGRLEVEYRDADGTAAGSVALRFTSAWKASEEREEVVIPRDERRAPASLVLSPF